MRSRRAKIAVDSTTYFAVVDFVAVAIPKEPQISTSFNRVCANH
jgi:hypothetical protein